MKFHSVRETMEVEKMVVLLLPWLIAGVLGSPARPFVMNPDGSYQFSFNTGQEAGNHFREESRDADGVVIGSYSFEDPSGSLRAVHYRADDSGFSAQGDVGAWGGSRGQVPNVYSNADDAPLEDNKAEDDSKEVNSDNKEPFSTTTMKPTTTTIITPTPDLEVPEEKEKPNSFVPNFSNFYPSLGGNRRLQDEVQKSVREENVPVVPMVYYPSHYVPWGSPWAMPYVPQGWSPKDVPRPVQFSQSSFDTSRPVQFSQSAFDAPRPVQFSQPAFSYPYHHQPHVRYGYGYSF